MAAAMTCASSAGIGTISMDWFNPSKASVMSATRNAYAKMTEYSSGLLFHSETQKGSPM